MSSPFPFKIIWDRELEIISAWPDCSIISNHDWGDGLILPTDTQSPDLELKTTSKSDLGWKCEEWDIQRWFLQRPRAKIKLIVAHFYLLLLFLSLQHLPCLQCSTVHLCSLDNAFAWTEWNDRNPCDQRSLTHRHTHKHTHSEPKASIVQWCPLLHWDSVHCLTVSDWWMTAHV